MKLLTERVVQKSIVEYLSRKGWSRNLRATGEKEHGVDIKVRNNKFSRYWLVEVKGDASKTAKYPRSHREVNFNLAIGQIVTRMRWGGKSGYKYGPKYGIGFPESFEDLVRRRLPYDVCYKLNLHVFLVNADGKVKSYDWKQLKAIQRD